MHLPVSSRNTFRNTRASRIPLLAGATDASHSCVASCGILDDAMELITYRMSQSETSGSRQPGFSPGFYLERLRSFSGGLACSFHSYSKVSLVGCVLMKVNGLTEFWSLCGKKKKKWKSIEREELVPSTRRATTPEIYPSLDRKQCPSAMA